MSYWQEDIDLGSVLKKDDPTKYAASAICPVMIKISIAKEISKSQQLSKFALEVNNAITFQDLNNAIENIYKEADLLHVWLNLE